VLATTAPGSELDRSFKGGLGLAWMAKQKKEIVVAVVKEERAVSNRSSPGPNLSPSKYLYTCCSCDNNGDSIGGQCA